MLRDEDLRRAKLYFDGKAIASNFVEAPYRGPTLHVNETAGIPLEFCAYMPPQERIHDQFQLQKGAAALRLDHFQLLSPTVEAAAAFYADLGFSVSDWFADGPDDIEALGIFRYRKQTRTTWFS